MYKDLTRTVVGLWQCVIMFAILLQLARPLSAVPQGHISYDEASQEKVIEALSGLGFADNCVEYLETGSAGKCDKCIDTMQFTERLCVVLGGDPKICALQCNIKRCCTLNEEKSLEASLSNSARAVLLGVARNLMKQTNGSRLCLQCLPVDED